MLIALTGGVQDIFHGIHEGSKGAKEDDERDDDYVEKRLSRQNIGHLQGRYKHQQGIE